MNQKETRELLELFSLQPIQTLGQNFLVDDNICRRILEQAAPASDDLVLEIGAGLGALTRLAARSAGKVVAIEIDRYVLPALSHVLTGLDNVEIIHADARETDFRQLAAAWSGKVLVLGNLPYYITTPLITKIICELPQARSIILMVQREAAWRLMAPAGSRRYGPLAILAALYGQTEKLADVPRGSFYPQPHVDSVLLRLTGGHDLPDREFAPLAAFLDRSFTRRRKTLINSWREAGMQTPMLAKSLTDGGLPANVRPETVTPQQYLRLFGALQDEGI